MTENYQENKTKSLTQREHVLARTEMYLGSTDLTQENQLIFKDGKISNMMVEYYPILVTMVREIINNSIDEFIRTNGDFSNRIEITIENNEITVIDNGRGIPSEIELKSGLPSPVTCVTSLNAGGNFSHDSTSKCQGKNGVGSSCVNCASKSFILTTSDGKIKTIVKCKNNMSNDDTSFTQEKSTKKFTEVLFTPDYERFDIKEFGVFEMAILKKYLIDQSVCYPGITFILNGKIFKCNSFKDYVNYYADKPEIFEYKHCDIAVYSGDENSIISFVNGLNCNSGTHVEYIKKSIVDEIRERYSKKIKMMPSDIYSNLHFIIIMKDVISPKFTSQIKDKLSSAISKTKYLYEDINFKKIALKISQNKKIMESILLIYRAKEELRKKNELNKKEKDIGKTILIPKLIEASIKNKKMNRIYLAEGDSALNKFARHKTSYMAGFPLRGKFISCWDRSANKLMENREVFTLCKILGLKMSDPSIKNGNYAEIVITTDADEDGSHICGLIMEWIYKYWPDYIKNGKLFRTVSPLIVLEDGQRFYTLTEFKKYQNKMISEEKEISKMLEYNKGLGSLSNERYAEMLNTLQPITMGEAEECHKSLSLAFSSHQISNRKKWLM